MQHNYSMMEFESTKSFLLSQVNYSHDQKDSDHLVQGKLVPKLTLRIHLILMRIRILILDPHWKKMDPDQVNFFPDLQNNFQIFCFIFFFAYFYPKT